MKDTIIVNEIFGPTIQGEGPSVGQLCTFIRLGTCNLHCQWCFGVKPGRRVPRIVTSRGQNKKIFNVETGDILLTYDEQKELVETTVTNVISRDVEQWYELLIDNILYFVTPEHPFFTSRGMIEARALVIGDQILHCSPYDKSSFRMIKDNPMKDEETSMKVHSKIDRKALAIKISKTVKEKQEKGTYIRPWDMLTEEKKIEIRHFHSERMKGENNPNWGGGSKTPNFDMLKVKCATGELYICEECGQDAKLEVHHLNDCTVEEYPSNDQLENLGAWCHLCHSKHHKRGYNFWVSPRSDGKVLSEGIVARNGKEVQQIKFIDLTKKEFYGRPYGPKPLKVYNLSCEPHNSYLVDYMWVHNCDTAYTWRFTDKYPHISNKVYDPREELNPMTNQEILDKVSPLNPPMIIISGGEPMLQAEKLEVLIPFLIQNINALTRIEIETAGTIFSNKLVDLPYLFFNVSPKLENSGNPKSLRYRPDVLEQFVYDAQAIFKFVVCDEGDFDEIEEIVKEVRIPRHRIYVMPEGISSEVQTGRMQYLADEVIKRRWNLTPRLHVMIWQNRRGV